MFFWNENSLKVLQIGVNVSYPLITPVGALLNNFFGKIITGLTPFGLHVVQSKLAHLTEHYRTLILDYCAL